MNEWHTDIKCPECGSTDTRFIELRNEMSLFECDACGCRFEIEEGD